jgi:hypothetical protein
MIPTWIFDLLAACMLVVAAVSAARLAAAQPWRHGSVIIDTDIAHLLMAIAMAGVLTPGLSTLPNVAWEVIFGLMIVWFAFRVIRDARANGVRALAGGHCAPHLVHSGAMLYMFLGMTSAVGAMAGMAGMPGMSAGSSSMLMLTDPTLAFVFALVLIGYSVWDLDQLSGRRYSLTSARSCGRPGDGGCRVNEGYGVLRTGPLQRHRERRPAHRLGTRRRRRASRRGRCPRPVPPVACRDDRLPRNHGRRDDIHAIDSHMKLIDFTAPDTP